MLAAIGLVATPTPTPAAADDHPYTTPGEREYNGRMWRTTCEPYSTTVTRCRAEILATQARLDNGRYKLFNEYVFNNLTYLPSPRADWKNNPLARNGQFTGTDGRMWKTECNTEWTGSNGCRSFVWATVINAKKTAKGWTFTPENKWVFNNVVQFTATTTPPPVDPAYDNPCHAKAPPVGASPRTAGRTSSRRPTSRTRTTTRSRCRTSSSSACVRRRSTTPTAPASRCSGRTTSSRGDHAHRPGQRPRQHVVAVPVLVQRESGRRPLPNPWYSGLGQAGAMASMLELADFTGDAKWDRYADQLFNSYLVAMQDGGFTNRANGFLWFEEYPTTRRRPSSTTATSRPSSRSTPTPRSARAPRTRPGPGRCSRRQSRTWPSRCPAWRCRPRAARCRPTTCSAATTPSRCEPSRRARRPPSVPPGSTAGRSPTSRSGSPRRSGPTCSPTPP
nr:D-glucuronyl C5-epimerase family protein [Tessaracoccus coleopterorum]